MQKKLKTVKLILSIIFSILLTNVMISQDVVISPRYQNILVCGINNPLEVIAKNVDTDSLYLYTNNGEINNFIIAPEKTGHTWISVNRITPKDTIELDRLHFRTISIERYIEPTIRGEGNNAVMPKHALLISNISSQVVDLDLCVNLKIKEFRVIAIRDDTIVFTRMVYSGKITPELKNDFELLKSGDIVHFTDIVAIGNPQKLFNVKPMKIIIE